MQQDFFSIAISMTENLSARNSFFFFQLNWVIVYHLGHKDVSFFNHHHQEGWVLIYMKHAMCNHRTMHPITVSKTKHVCSSIMVIPSSFMQCYSIAFLGCKIDNHNSDNNSHNTTFPSSYGPLKYQKLKVRLSDRMNCSRKMNNGYSFMRKTSFE